VKRGKVGREGALVVIGVDRRLGDGNAGGHEDQCTRSGDRGNRDQGNRDW
jgi:hypothetical protein